MKREFFERRGREGYAEDAEKQPNFEFLFCDLCDLCDLCEVLRTLRSKMYLIL